MVDINFNEWYFRAYVIFKNEREDDFVIFLKEFVKIITHFNYV